MLPLNVTSCGVIKLGNEGDTYQPFVFLASYQPEEEKGKPASSIVDLPITDIWFSYYKDLRGHQRADGSRGRLKMGYGPGGPPVIGVPQLLDLLRHVLKLKMTTNSDVAALLTAQTPNREIVKWPLSAESLSHSVDNRGR